MYRHPLLAAILLVCLVGRLPVAPAQDLPRWAPYRSRAPVESPALIESPAIIESPAVEPVWSGSPVAGSPNAFEPLPSLQPGPPVCVDCLPGSMAVPGVGRAGGVRSGWQGRLLPEGLIWHSYLAGVREPRISGIVYADRQGTPYLDVALGGRMAIWRYGTDHPVQPEGYELQIEGAALPRLDLDQYWDLDAVDFRFGVPLTWGNDRWQWKAGYYHLSSHLGDELAAREGILNQRINYSRDVLLAGFSYYPLPAWRWYAEAGWAFYTDGGAEPWEFQFGLDLATPGPTGPGGVPFAAVNGHLREEVDFGGNLTVQAGWLWRGNSGRVLRTGVHYYNGKSSQYQFFNLFEEQIGAGLWGEF